MYLLGFNINIGPGANKLHIRAANWSDLWQEDDDPQVVINNYRVTQILIFHALIPFSFGSHGFINLGLRI